MPIEGSCHCGAVRFSFNSRPEWAVSCNCSICRRLAALWIYAEAGRISMRMEPDATRRYIRSEANLAFHSCRTCGCTTHWENLAEPEGRMAVNLRLADADVAETIPVRRFDGADSWSFID